MVHLSLLLFASYIALLIDVCFAIRFALMFFYVAMLCVVVLNMHALCMRSSFAIYLLVCKVWNVVNGKFGWRLLKEKGRLT